MRVVHTVGKKTEKNLEEEGLGEERVVARTSDYSCVEMRSWLAPARWRRRHSGLSLNAIKWGAEEG